MRAICCARQVALADIATIVNLFALVVEGNGTKTKNQIYVLFVGVEDVSKDLLSGDGALFSPVRRNLHVPPRGMSHRDPPSLAEGGRGGVVSSQWARISPNTKKNFKN